MNTSKKSTRIGPGRFQWNAGAWFGSLLGSSAWMAVAAVFLLLNEQVLLASVPAVGFATVLMGALLLWSRRDSVFPFPAIMAMLALLAIATPVVWIAVQSLGSPPVLAAMNWPQAGWITIFVAAIVPAIMIWFLVLERSGTPRNSGDEHNRNTMGSRIRR